MDQRLRPSDPVPLGFEVDTAALDVPDIEFSHVEIADDAGPYGAKCVGEPALVPTAPAILNAIHNAIGVRIYDLPATPEKILRALDAASVR